MTRSPEGKPIKTLHEFQAIAQGIAEMQEPVVLDLPALVEPKPTESHAVEVAKRMVKLSGERERAIPDTTRRVSEAAADQGWGPIVPEDLPQPPKKAKKIRPFRGGPIRGESEGEMERPYGDRHLDEKAKKIGRAGVAGISEALAKSLQDKTE